MKRNLLRLKELQYRQHEVIVVDNNSADGSREMVLTCFPEFKLISSTVNRGVSGGRNLGFRAAKGQFIIYLDDDTLAPVDLCQKTEKAFERNKRIGCLAYLIKNMPDGHYNNVATTDFLLSYHGAAHAFRRSALDSIGYLDERFFFGGEEIDSSLRLYDIGYLTYYFPDVVIKHFPQKYTGAERYQRTSNWIASWGWFYLKHFPITLAMLCISRLLLSHALNAVRIKSAAPLVGGIQKLASGAPSILKERKRASIPTINFYMAETSQPEHFNRSFLAKIFRKIANFPK